MSQYVHSVTGNPLGDLIINSSSTGYVSIKFSDGTGRIYAIADLRDALEVAEENAAVAVRAKRRDEVCAELFAQHCYDPENRPDYAQTTPVVKLAIDRIIELENTK